jgi:hypothetical protein
MVMTPYHYVFMTKPRFIVYDALENKAAIIALNVAFDALNVNGGLNHIGGLIYEVISEILLN